MPPLVNVGATAMCPHGGQMTIVPTNTRVLAAGTPVATMADTFVIAGCAFVIPPTTPHPCVLVQFLMPATRVLVNGSPAILQTSTGLAKAADQVPQGPPVIVSTQPRVQGL